MKGNIVAIVYGGKKDGVSFRDISKALGTDKKREKKLKNELDSMVNSRVLNRTSKDKYLLRDRKKYFEATVVKVAPKLGFVKDEKGEEYFVPGRDLHGCIEGDYVLAKFVQDKDEYNRSAVAQVVGVIKESDKLLTGVIIMERMKLFVLPDSIGNYPLSIVKTGKRLLKVGDKVAFTIRQRGERHSEHTVDIADVFGNSGNARVCADAYLAENNIAVDFPLEVLDEARRIGFGDTVDMDEAGRRFDLRKETIFTIDGADTKDIDDAISITKDDKCYHLGVHIADVSYYVKRNSPLDKEAFARGTSIYFADSVIPMLPKELSNGICSLNPKVDRLAFSCLMEVGFDGKLLDYRFEKTVIRSRVQGVYSEINQIIDGNPSDSIKEKYSEVIDRIPIMKELSDILSLNRKNRGAPEIDTLETKIVTNDEGLCIDVKARERGISEGIIEEFMLMANNAAASVGMSEKIPFVYRIHEDPSSEKLLILQETLTRLGVDAKGINEKSKASDLAAIIASNKGNEKYRVINNVVLRTMMKAKYSSEPVGHYGLVMKEYSHFTSPIRRYADLTIHRILTDYVYSMSKEKLFKQYGEWAPKAALQASSTELVAVQCERECENFYMAEYMKSHIGESYKAIISGVTPNGLFVQLENTVEGMVSVLSLPNGMYEAVDNIALVETMTKTAYTIGDTLNVTCTAANVNSGLIDFVLSEKKDLAETAPVGD